MANPIHTICPMVAYIIKILSNDLINMLRFRELPSLSENTHFLVRISTNPDNSTLRGIHRYGLSKVKPRTRMVDDIATAKYFFIKFKIISANVSG